jgi:hypothetical protein
MKIGTNGVGERRPTSAPMRAAQITSERREKEREERTMKKLAPV